MKSVYYSVAGKPLGVHEKPPAAAKRPKVVRWLRELSVVDLHRLTALEDPERLRRALLLLAGR